MNYIIKGEEPKELTIFRANRKNLNKNWDDENIPICLKSAIRKSLIAEQHNRCAYCTREIDEKCQIEHYIPRNGNPKLTWDYNNMFGVDNSQAMPVKYKNTCENGRGSILLEIDPRNRQHINEIYYSQNGRIKHDKYQNDLDNVLCLNNQVYTEYRKSLLSNLENRLKIMAANGVQINMDEIRKEYVDDKDIVKPLCGIVIWFIDNNKIKY